MPRIIDLAIKVDGLDGATKLYEELFGFTHVSTIPSPGHARHLTDRATILSLLKYDSEASPEALLAGSGSRLHHFWIEIDDPVRHEKALTEAGCEIISGSADKLPTKFRTPHGIVAEILRPDLFKPQ